MATFQVAQTQLILRLRKCLRNLLLVTCPHSRGYPCELSVTIAQKRSIMALT